jgi:hypothetical protein
MGLFALASVCQNSHRPHAVSLPVPASSFRSNECPIRTVGLMSDIACARMTALLRLSMSSGPGSKQGYCRRICVSFTPAAVRQAIAARRDPWDFVYALCVASAREFSADERITSHDLAVWVPVLSWLVQRLVLVFLRLYR